MGGAYHLAHLNIARMKFGWDDPAMKDFMDALDPVNAVADASPGFVWRLVEETPGEALVWNDPDWLVNVSVWESLEALKAFVRSELHLAVMRRRRDWFTETVEAYTVLWWVPAGLVPTVQEAQARLELLRERGPSPEAFNFSDPFPAPGLK